MTSSAIRKTFLDFFKRKGHEIVPSAPMVIKNDPTLMFTNAGMNQFKDFFLGNAVPKYKRVADTQKCLRVSGKHNDLEEVGVDTYHHTMFEMLGNWSFGDYFKKEAIEWAWELLTEVYKIPKDRLYVTVFEGDEKEKLAFDTDSYNYWKNCLSAAGFSEAEIAEDRILKGNKKDNFWEMGDTGPCGPCSEIHVDLRDDDERKKTDGKNLVNANNPLVIEIWNNVFMEFNRKADGSLEQLPAKHVDTGMGFERLCMVLQNKKSNYDTDVFQPLIQFISEHCKIKYSGTSPLSFGEGQGVRSDIAMRVMSDHIRAISFAIADGQLPSNNKAGYVIRRILRRAVRYGFTFLNFKEPFIYKLVALLAEQFKEVFPELTSQKDFIQKVIHEEEVSFLRTLETGIKKFENIRSPVVDEGGSEDFFKKYTSYMDGGTIFQLYDTFGFPVDLIQLMAREKNILLDMEGFNTHLEVQKIRSRAAAVVDTEDWIVLKQDEPTEFVGYDELECEAEIIKYRKVKSKGKEQFQIVLNKTPFYAESGGQVGDTGYLEEVGNQKSEIRKIFITDTQKENNLIIHFSDKLPADINAKFTARVNTSRRKEITSNHSATHLMHAALRNVLGKHVAQKGSLVNENVTRFDFSHFAKVTDEELEKIEKMVNEKIRENIPLDEKRNVPVKEAMNMGAMALFGEKYGEFVRVITFDKNFSVELCGGTHVPATGQIGLFKIISESSVAAGVRRVEAITGKGVEKHFEEQNKKKAASENALKERIELLKLKASSFYSKISTRTNNDFENFFSLEINSSDTLNNKEEAIQKLIDKLTREISRHVKSELVTKVTSVNGVNLIAEKIDLPSADAIKNLSFDLKKEVNNLFLLLAAEIDGKAHLSLIISENLVKEKNLDAKKIISELSKEIQGGGGGQAFYATAGGKNPGGIGKVLEKTKGFLPVEN
ncbi:MAG TPA: alanine--tRNA ligase [Bacteroidia bacterium]|nr:alanine--tRNA ligase [Bacteroidia bacterium]